MVAGAVVAGAVVAGGSVVAGAVVGVAGDGDAVGGPGSSLRTQKPIRQSSRTISATMIAAINHWLRRCPRACVAGAALEEAGFSAMPE